MQKPLPLIHVYYIIATKKRDLHVPLYAQQECRINDGRDDMSSPRAANGVYSLHPQRLTKRWHVTISCPPDGHPPQPVRPWKSGRVHLAEGSNVVFFRITVFYGVLAGEQKVCEWGRKIWKI